MNIALLFNSDDPKYDGSYGDPIRKAVFSLDVLQASGRHMKVSLGDILIYSNSKNLSHYDELTNRVYFSGLWAILLEERLRATFRKNTVYALVFENITRSIAVQLHSLLALDSAYLGAMQVEYSYGPHLALMRNSMINRYRIEGRVCRLFITMGEDEERDEYEAQGMREVGYEDVDWEDRGAHGTIFDEYDTIDHFKRVSSFREAVSPFMPDGEDGAYELVMVLEDLNPQLFNALGAAVRALEAAQTEEDVAQAAISGRRYMEKLADVLFPPRKDKFKNRKVGPSEYKNRLWAYVDDSLDGNAERIEKFGVEIDRLVNEFNAGLHGDRTKDSMVKSLSEVGTLTASLLALNPEESRKPYYAHQKSMFDFFRSNIDKYRVEEPNP